MSDFESCLRDTLTARSASAPEASGLADGARRRLRRRRTSWSVVAAAVVAGVIPLALGLGAGHDPRTDDPAPVASEPPAVADGFKAETWHDLTFEVPEDWGHGGSDWCVDGATLEEAGPRVARPDTITRMILCSPASGYGATIASAAAFDAVNPSGSVWQYSTEGVDEAMYPDGAWLGYWYDDRDVVTVATPDRDMTQRIVDSVTRFEGTDPNGCPPMLGDAEALTSTEHQLLLCRYDEQDLLAASGSWAGEDAATRWTVLEEAPVASVDPDCNEATPRRVVILDRDGYRGTAVTDGCRKGIAMYFAGATREVTPEAFQVLASIG